MGGSPGPETDGHEQYGPQSGRGDDGGPVASAAGETAVAASALPSADSVIRYQAVRAQLAALVRCYAPIWAGMGACVVLWAWPGRHPLLGAPLTPAARHWRQVEGGASGDEAWTFFNDQVAALIRSRERYLVESMVRVLR